RTDRPIDQPRREGLVLDRRALALEVPAGNTAAGVRTLAILDGEREEVLAVAGRLGRHARGEHHAAAVAHDDGAVGLLGDLAGLEGEGLAIDVERNGVSLIHVSACPRESAGSRRTLWSPGFIPTEDQPCTALRFGLS